MTRAPDPLTAYNPRHVNLLVAASLTKQELFADAKPPRIVTGLTEAALRTYILDVTEVRTRWRILQFSTPDAARRFNDFRRLATTLYRLITRMERDKDERFETVKSVKISLDEARGALILEPKREAFNDLLDELQITAPTPPDRKLSHDPLADFEPDSEDSP